MCFALFISSISAFNIPNYRTNFYSTPPKHFNSSAYSHTQQYQMGSTSYTCYFAPDNNPHTDKNPIEYLKSKLGGKCFEFTHTNYWYFTFCPFRNLVQYRYDKNGADRIDLFTLGKEENYQYSFVDRGIGTNWTNGDICFVDKKPRRTRIEFLCDLSHDSDGILTSISEPAFCQYVVKFHTQHACAFPNITNESLTDIVCISDSPTGNS